MLARIFGQINSSTTIIIGLLAILVSTAHFYFSPVLRFSLKTAWGSFDFIPLAGYSFYTVGILIIVYGVQWLFEFKFKLLKRNAFLPFFMLILVLIFLPITQLNLLLEMALFLVILYNWLQVYQGEKLLGRTLNTAILIGLCALLDIRMSLLLIFSFLVYLIFGRLNVRTFFILIVGFATVWLDALALEYIFFDSSTVYDYFLLNFNADSWLPLREFTLPFIVLLSVLLIPALIEFSNTIVRASVFKRQANTIFAALVVFSSLSFFVYGIELFQFVILLPALALLFVNYLQYVKRLWMQELIMWLALLVLVLFDSGLI